jgi:hypothetical protein
VDDILTEFIAGIADATPVVAGVFGAIIGLVFIFAIGRFIVSRVRGSVK